MTKAIILLAVAIVMYKLINGHSDHPVRWSRPDWN